jgi:uncharacterized protein (TIGR03086 family)
MSTVDFIARAVVPLVEVARDIKPDQLAAPTPCAEYDVRKLVHHLLFWGPSLEGAARKETVAPPAAAEADLDLVDDDWAAALAAQAQRTAAAWSDPAAWEGVTHMGGPMELGASMVGAMVAGELVVHGWDLARAAGRHVTWDDELLAYLYEETAKTVDMGRGMGMFAPEVVVPASAPLLDRLLGMTGRDPAWECQGSR